MSHCPLYNPSAVQHVRQVANALLANSIGVIQAARRMTEVRLCSVASGTKVDQDYAFFIGIDSETDHLPIGDVRRFWAKDALSQKDEEIEGYETSHRLEAQNAARNLLAKLDQLA